MAGEFRRAGVALLALFLFAGAFAGTARADKAAEHVMELKARENFAAGRYGEALDLFAKLYAETLHPVYLRNIGRCQQKLREPTKAIDAFQDYLAKEKKISAEERAEIEGYMKEVAALRDEQARQAQAPVAPPVPGPSPNAGAQPAPSPWVTPVPSTGASPTGAAPPAANPGWSSSAPPAAMPPSDAAGSPSATLVAASPPPAEESSPVYKKWWFWTAVGAVAAGGIVAALVLSGGTVKPNCPSYALKCL